MAIGYMETTTASNCRAETTGAGAVGSTGIVEWRGLVSMPNWHQGSFSTHALGTHRGQWSVVLRGWTTSSDGDRFQLNWHDGTTTQNIQSNAGLPLFDPYDWVWIRFVFDPNDGANRTLDCYYSTDDPLTALASVSWTAVGTQVTGTTTTIRAATSTAAGVGGDSTLTGASPNNNRFGLASVRFDGAELMDPDFRDADQGWNSPPATDSYALSYSLINSAIWVPPDVKLVGRSVHYDFATKRVVIESGV